MAFTIIKSNVTNNVDIFILTKIDHKCTKLHNQARNIIYPDMVCLTQIWLRLCYLKMHENAH